MHLNVLGNSATATKLATARNIKLQGAVSGDVNFDGNTNVIINTTQSNIAVIKGSMLLEPNTQANLSLSPVKLTRTQKSINFPEEYNKNNCIVLACNFKSSENQGFSGGFSNYPDTGDNMIASMPYTISLGSSASDTNISLRVGNMSTAEKTIYYQIILMKIL